MRDEMDARLWNAHYKDFSDGMAAGLGRAGAGLRRLNRAVPMPLKLMGVVLAASLATLTAPPPAQAAQVVEAPAVTVAVGYGDLDLRTEAGRQALTARIHGAARQICQPELIGSLEERADRRACFTAAIAGADAQLQRALAANAGRTRSIAVAAR